MAEKLHVHIGPKVRVVGQIPSVMIRIFVQDYIVRIPSPIVHVRHIVGSHRPVASCEEEVIRPAAVQAPPVLGPETALKAAVFPGIVYVIVRVIAAAVVSHPVPSVYMRSIGVARAIAVVPPVIVISPASLIRRLPPLILMAIPLVPVMVTVSPVMVAILLMGVATIRNRTTRRGAVLPLTLLIPTLMVISLLCESR